jgi:hypothetical protein
MALWHFEFRHEFRHIIVQSYVFHRHYGDERQKTNVFLDSAGAVDWQFARFRLHPAIMAAANKTNKRAPASMQEVTRILNAIDQGDPHAAEKLLPLEYSELRKLAAQKLAQSGGTEANAAGHGAGA